VQPHHILPGYIGNLPVAEGRLYEKSEEPAVLTGGCWLSLRRDVFFREARAKVRHRCGRAVLRSRRRRIAAMGDYTE